jgi:phytoene synthase
MVGNALRESGMCQSQWRPSPEDAAACRAILARGSKSFNAAFYLLPRRARDSIAALYAFCRVADDAVDGAGADAEALDGLAERVERIFGDGPAEGPVDRAFAAVVRAHGIPRPVVEALLEGFRWDLEGRRYETLSEVRAYSARVAATVGVMMALVLGERRPATLGRACDLGVAMQLTNIARDVGEDARRGRIYLPLQMLRQSGLDPGRWVARPAFSPALGEVVERVLLEADALYRRADAGIPSLPRDSRLAVRAARLVYAEIGEVIRAARYDSVTRRAVTTTGRKLLLLLRALAPRWEEADRKLAGAPPLEEAAFLVAAAGGAAACTASANGSSGDSRGL